MNKTQTAVATTNATAASGLLRRKPSSSAHQGWPTRKMAATAIAAPAQSAYELATKRRVVGPASGRNRTKPLRSPRVEMLASKVSAEITDAPMPTIAGDSQCAASAQ